MVVAQEGYNHYSLPEEESRVIRHPKKSWIPSKGRYVITGLVLLTFCTGMLVAYYYSQVIASGYKIHSLSNDLAAISQETALLSEEVERLSSLDRVEYLATNKLKMVKPEGKDVVLVRADLAAERDEKNNTGPGDLMDKQLEDGQSQGKSKVIQAFAYLMGIKGI